MTHRTESGPGWTMHLGDCREILPTLTGIDAIVTDPPYGVGFAAVPTKWQRLDGAQIEHWDDAVADLDPLLSIGVPTLIWGGNHYPLPPTRSWLAWTKPDAAPSFGSVEFAWTNTDQLPRHIECSVSSTNRERVSHPTQKPLRVMKWCMSQIKIPTGCVVLDPFCGSGTTGVACIETGRSFVGIEIDEKYFNVACNRLRSATPCLFGKGAER